MKKAIASISVALSLALPALCLAQEAPLASPAPANAAAPAPAEPQLVVVPIPTAPAQAELTREERRRLTLHDREVTRLLRVMAKEGNEFSQEKYERYRGLVSGGALFIVLGSLSVFTGAVYGFYSLGKELSQVNWDAESEDDDTEDDYETNVGLLAGLLISGAASLGVGIALTAAGKRGKKRQELLLHKREILAPPGVTLSFFADPGRGAGGLSLRATF